MRDPRDIIKRPVITERSMEMMAEKKYTFDVDVKSNKTEVKDALEAIFGVKVEKSEHHELQAESKTRWSSRWFY